MRRVRLINGEAQDTGESDDTNNPRGDRQKGREADTFKPVVTFL